MTDPTYKNLERALAADGIHCQFQAPDQFVISEQTWPAGPDCGNSFWVTHAGGKWHLFTWKPTGYFLPDGARIAELCKAFVAHGDRAASIVPAPIAVAFSLSELSDAEAEAVYGYMSA